MQHDAQIGLRLPRPALLALRKLSKQTGVTMGEIIRSGLNQRLAMLIPELIQMSERAERSPQRALTAIRMLDLCTEASLYLGPHGLEIARKRARDDNAKNVSSHRAKAGT